MYATYNDNTIVEHLYYKERDRIHTIHIYGDSTPNYTEYKHSAKKKQKKKTNDKTNKKTTT